jgi:hypothetical protein
MIPPISEAVMQGAPPPPSACLVSSSPVAILEVGDSEAKQEDASDAQDSDDDEFSFITLSSNTDQSEDIASEDSTRSGESHEYNPEIGLDDDSFIENDM